MVDVQNQGGATKLALGRLVPVGIREVWPHEAKDFTPWLAEPENLSLLAETLRLGELQVQGIEVPVGNFFIDILARDIEGRVVVIENQFGQTDHTHLGQILTYIAGQDGHATVVWIAETIREEHRAAIDWLNGSTFEGFDFFAVKVEALRIGESPPAPWFNVVAKPNNWTRGVGRVTRATSDLPTEQQILGRLENSVGNSVGGSIRELAEWASAQGFILRPTGKNLYFGCRNKDGERVEPFSLDTDGVLWAQFGECKKGHRLMRRRHCSSCEIG